MFLLFRNFWQREALPQLDESAVSDNNGDADEDDQSMPHPQLDDSAVSDDEDDDGPSAPPQLDESSLLSDPQAGDVSVRELQYEIVDASSKRGKPKLVDTCGYSYTLKYEGSDFTTWTCSVRNKNVTCRASVRQHGNAFWRNSTDHTHPPVPGTDVAHRVSAQVKAAAADNLFVPASQLVKDAFLKENVDSTRKPLDAVPRPQHLERYANNHRRRNRPADPDPSNLHFELDLNHIPDDFCKGDVNVGSRRHNMWRK